MKKYEQPTLEVVELSVKESITADAAFGDIVNGDGVYDSETGITTYNLKLYSNSGSEA